MDLYREYKKPYKSVLFVISNSVSDFRLALASRWLKEWGYHTELVDFVPGWIAAKFDVIVISRPGLEMCDLIRPWLDAGKTIVIDMDDDFAAIPSHNPAYKFIGAGRPGYIKKLHETISRATVLVGTTPEIPKRYGREGVIIPNCWDEKNPIWDAPKYDSDLIKIGWVGTNTHLMDFKMVFEPLMQILNEYPNTSISIGLDHKLYDLFQDVPEIRKFFMPGMPYEVYPAFYRHVNIALAPLEDNVFNRAKSEIKLIEAGAGHCAWIASPLPFYEEWAVGGLISPPGDWYKSLKAMVEDDVLRKTCAIAARGKSISRTSEIFAREWQKLIESL